MNKHFLLFDVDRTLLDFKKSEQIALKKSLEDFSFSYSEQIRARYEAINQYYWEEFEKGKIEKSKFLSARFDDLFREFGFSGDSVAFDRYYRNELSKIAELIDGADKLLIRLKQKGFQIYYVTNGTREVQWPRLRKSGLESLADGIFISEEIGFQKPEKAYFEIVFSKISDFNKEEAVIIGDSLTSDIQGGLNMGIDTVWYNPTGEENTLGIPVTYEISDLRELESLL
ncbi:MAG: YjjG family noncanonical pyrimidine nucleotidase [Clostridia bacterium]|nr:YjjG family noncanonical pyrimidine nucleotidase [Clostridia bacterium]